MFIKFKGFLIPRFIACMIYERLIVFNGTGISASTFSGNSLCRSKRSEIKQKKEYHVRKSQTGKDS